MTPFDERRRQLLYKTLFGATGLGLRALATNLPLAFLLNPHRAVAAELATVPQYLVLATSGEGHPLGNNAPGSYAANAVHDGDPKMAATTFSLGAKSVVGAQVWSTLPDWVRNRTAFVHHATYTTVHTDYPQILTLRGAVADKDTLVSKIAAGTAGSLKTIQAQPVALGDSSQSAAGRKLAQLPPTALASLLGSDSGPLGQLKAIRDQTVDALNNVLKARGNKVQRIYFDNMVQARTQAHSLSDTLLGDLTKIRDNSGPSQLLAAAVLTRMNLAPAYCVNLGFGGDNHPDPRKKLNSEVNDTAASVAGLTAFFTALKTYGLEDKVVLASFDVFGRTYTSFGTEGRDHWANASCGLLIGQKVTGGVVGGLMPTGKELRATGIDAASGASVPGGGDVPYEDLLTSTGKTIAAACGIDSATIDKTISGGRIITGALARAT